MATYNSNDRLRMNFPQRGWNHSDQSNPDMLRHEVSRLKGLLSNETAKYMAERERACQLNQELEETKFQWNRQKQLKEMVINQRKETQKELERLQKYSDADTLCSAKIGSQVYSTIRQKKKKDLHKDYEELKVAHVISQKKYESDLEAEKEKNKGLQEQLENLVFNQRQLEEERNAHSDELVKMKTAYQELSFKSESDILAAKNETESLQRQLEEEKRARQQEVEMLQVSYNQLILKYETDVSAEREQNEALQHQLEEERNAHHEELVRMKTAYQELSLKHESDILSAKKETETLQHQLEEEKRARQQQVETMEVSYNQLTLNYETDISAERQQTEALQNQLEEMKSYNNRLSQDHDKLKNKHEMCCENMTQKILTLEQTLSEKELQFEAELEQLRTQLDEEVSNNTDTDLDLTVAEVSVPTFPETTRKRSLWKRTRHFLGLRKPKSWNKTSTESAQVPPHGGD